MSPIDLLLLAFLSPVDDEVAVVLGD